jgi:hypothetical protein
MRDVNDDVIVKTLHSNEDFSAPLGFWNSEVRFRPNERSSWSTPISCADIDQMKYNVMLSKLFSLFLS